MRQMLKFESKRRLEKYILSRLSKRLRRQHGTWFRVREISLGSGTDKTVFGLEYKSTSERFGDFRYFREHGNITVEELDYAIRTINQMALTGEYTRDIHHVSP